MNKPVILCIDDEPTILYSLKIELQLAFGNEFIIEAAEDGAEALELIAELLSDEYEVPLVISDHIMPHMKGDELLTRIHDISPKTIKIMLTGQADLEAVVRVINQANLYRYIHKPWQSEDLKLTVTKAINSYFQDKKLAEQNAKLQYMNQALEELTRQQANLIIQLQEAQAERQSLIDKLFALNNNLEMALEAELELTKASQRFVPNEFLSLLGHESLVDIKLGDQVQREMSVLFADIRDFTMLSEQMTPEDNFKFINAYLSRMEPAITENHGFIDKYIGDGIMALFDSSADDAVKAGITMLQTLSSYNQHRQNSGYTPIKLGIGINTGSLMLGTVGGQNRMDGTVISNAVNLAARVECLTKNYGVSMLITHQTFLRLNEPIYAIRPIGQVAVKGKSDLVLVYEVFEADAPEIKEGKLATYQMFIEALHHYRLGKLVEARQLFGDCLRQNPIDRVARIYWQRCQDKCSPQSQLNINKVGAGGTQRYYA